MPEVQPSVDALGNVMSPPEPRAALFWDGTHWRAATVDAAGHIQIDVVTSGLPAGAATAAAQALALAQLQLIEDMRDALQSVGTDRLIVRGMDQLWSIKGLWHEKVTETNATAPDDNLVTLGLGAGSFWVLTQVAARDRNNVTTEILLSVIHNGVQYFLGSTMPTVAHQTVHWEGWVVLDAGDFVRADFYGVTAGDDLDLTVCGFEMTGEP